VKTSCNPSLSDANGARGAARPLGRSRRARSRASGRGASACSWDLASDDAEGQARLAAFHQRLQQLDWTVVTNVKIDYRWGAGNADYIRKFAAELVALAPDVILSAGSPSVAVTGAIVCGESRDPRHRPARHEPDLGKGTNP